MTDPDTRSTTRDSWRGWIRPAVVLPLIVAVVIGVAVLTPENSDARSGDARLTTHSTNSLGARVLYELAHKLGWTVARQETRGVPPYGDRTIRAVLAPPQTLTATETHAVLEDVRRGGGLLAVISPGEGALDDSLGVYTWFGAEYSAAPGIIEEDHQDEDCDKKMGRGLPLWPNSQVTLYALRWRKGVIPRDTTVFATVDVGHKLPGTAGDSGGVKPAAVGFPLGRGRVVVVSDPDLLRNDVLRLCDWHTDVVAVRMLEYLRGAPSGAGRTRIVFDEYHQGYGAHPGSIRAIVTYLGQTGSGRTLMQLLGAALVLLAAAAARPLPPRPDARVERRSPLDHVEALSRAYDRVHATRTVTRRLLQGIRRRVTLRASSGTLSDDDYLDAVAKRYPARREDVATIKHALRETGSRHDLERAGEALERIETSLTSTTKS